MWRLTKEISTQKYYQQNKFLPTFNFLKLMETEAGHLV
jgi:hypothetical protein